MGGALLVYLVLAMVFKLVVNGALCGVAAGIVLL